MKNLIGKCIKHRHKDKFTQGFVVYQDENTIIMKDTETEDMHTSFSSKSAVQVVSPTPLAYNRNREVEVTKELTFDSCHNLLEYDGACANLHGHTYKLHVTLRGKVDHTGMLLDFKDLKKAVQETVMEMFDHKYLNEQLYFNTTAENMVMFIYDMLACKLNSEDVYVRRISLWETPTSFATYDGGVR